MKRNKNLIELSRDHHHGLLLGWKIKQGLKRNVPFDELADYIIHFSREALFPHFKEEENQVLVYVNPDDPFCKRTLFEHAQLRGIVARISIKGLTDDKLLLTLAEKLDAHIRFEERELFPYIEKLLSIQQLDDMGKLISELHHPYTETYANEFWAG
jgi:hemerythrin-like domain-containing protein